MSDSSEDLQAADSVVAFVVRLSWLFFGPLLLFFLSVRTLREACWELSLTSVAFFGTVAVMIALRLLDIELLSGTTRNHEPASLSDWRRYSLWLVLSATAFWAVIQVVGCIEGGRPTASAAATHGAARGGCFLMRQSCRKETAVRPHVLSSPSPASLRYSVLRLMPSF